MPQAQARNRIEIERWQEGRRLLSLAEMIRFAARELYDALASINYWKETFKERISKHAKGSAPRSAQVSVLKADLVRLKNLCESLELAAAQERCESLFNHILVCEAVKLPDVGLGMVIEPPVLSEAATVGALDGITMAAWSELGKRKFAFIPTEKAVFYEQRALFGKGVLNAFPAAAPDIKDAGNCLAAGLYTAAVSHLMCATNVSVVALARHLKIKIKHLEHHDWGPILMAVGAKLEASHALKRGPKKQKLVEFYADILGELKALKDVHRNNVFHARKRYNEQEALGVYLRVKSLMQRLATRLSE